MSDTRTAESVRGMRDVIPIILGAVPFGLLFGALAAQWDFGLLNTMLLSILVNSGTMQVIGLNMMVLGVGWPLVAFASLIVNARHMFYSAALLPHVRKLSLGWRLAIAYGLTDQVFVLAERRYAARDESRCKHWYVMGASIALFVSWCAVTCLGYVFGDLLGDVHELGLDFAMYATYIALAASSFSNFRAVAVGVSAGLFATALVDLPYEGGMFFAIVAGVTVGLLADRLFGRPPQTQPRPPSRPSAEERPTAGVPESPVGPEPARRPDPV